MTSYDTPTTRIASCTFCFEEIAAMHSPQTGLQEIANYLNAQLSGTGVRVTLNQMQCAPDGLIASLHIVVETHV